MYENYSVLFVDDEVNILSSLKRGLIEEKYTSFFASSGKEALEILKENKMSVIVSDMRMPEMDGLQLLREVELLYPRIVKIILSGYTQLPQILTVINQVDIFKFITKPWKLVEEFKVAIHKALDFYVLQEENEDIKKILQNKNQAYINILKNIDEIVVAAKKSSDILGECGKQILLFNHQLSNQQISNQPKRVSSDLLLIQEKIFDLFISAVKGEEKENNCEAVLNDVIHSVEVFLPITKSEVKPVYLQRVKMYRKIAIALLTSCALIMEELYRKNGLYIVAAVNNSNIPTISFICPKDNNILIPENQQDIALINIKIELMNSVLTKVAQKSMMDLEVTVLNGNLITVLTLSLDQ